MVYAGAYIHGSSPTQLTIQKSMSSDSYVVNLILSVSRVLIATVRDMGNFPCPRCKIAKTQLPGLGTVTDMKIRQEGIRVDTQRQTKVAAARKLIYEDGYVVNSKRVDDLLKDESLVPTTVSQLMLIQTLPEMMSF